MSLGKYNLIGYCCAKMDKEPQNFFFDAIRKALVGTDYRLVTFCSFNDFTELDSDAQGALAVYDICNYDALDLMIISPMSIKDPMVTKKITDNCRKHNVPVLSLEEDFEDFGTLKFNLLGAFEEIVRHIVEYHHCSRIAVMAGMVNNEYSDTRIETVRKVLAENGLKLDDSLVMHGNFWDLPTEEAMEKFFESGEQLPDAIICCNDTMAIKVCEVLEKHGITVPDNVLVTGFDGISFEEVASPRLTTAGNNYDAVTKCIREIISSGDIRGSVSQNIILHNSITFSESCGCKPINLHNTTVNLINFYNKYHQIYEYQLFLSKFMTAMTDSAGSSSFRERTRNYILENMWICFNDKIKISQHNLCDKDKMRVYICRETGRNFNDSINYFPKSQMVPDYENVFERTYSVVITPIHFLDVVYGYIVKEPSEDIYDFHMLMMLEAQLEQGVEMVNRHEKLNEVNRKLNTLYQQDPMTRIYNRRGFYKRISLELQSNSESFVGLIGVDMDGLKEINDGFGHACGDRALIAIADAMSKAADSNTICARFGGDEFEIAVICSENIEDTVNKFVSNMLKNLDDYNKVNSAHNGFTVEISYGCCCEKISQLEDIDKLISASDTRMYSQKAVRKQSTKNKSL